MRLINADVLLKQSRRVVEYDEAGFSMEYNAVPTEIIKNAPTVGAVPVVRGEWVCIEQTTTYYETLIQECCSICGRKLTRTSTQPQVNFCPNCGADMRLKPELVVPTKQMEEALQKLQKELQKSRDKFFFGKKVDE